MKTSTLFSIFLSALFCCQIQLSAQQTTLTTFHRYNWQTINPAAVDRMQMFNEHRTLLNAAVRQQWLGFEGSPTLYHLSFEHMPRVNRDFPHQIKWGFSVFKDQAGEIGTYGITGNFQYYIRLSRGGKKFLHFGLSPSILRYQVAANQIQFKQDDPLSNVQINRLYGDFSFGIFYRQVNNRNKTGFYAGISSPQTISTNLEKRDDSGFLAKERKLHLNLITGGFLKPDRYSPFSIEPSLWIRYLPGVNYSSLAENLPVSADVNVRIYYFYDRGSNNSFWAGTGYGTNRNMKIEAGITLDKGQVFKGAGNTIDSDGAFRFGIGYELPMVSNGLNLGHSLDVNLTYAWD